MNFSTPGRSNAHVSQREQTSSTSETDKYQTTEWRLQQHQRQHYQRHAGGDDLDDSHLEEDFENFSPPADINFNEIWMNDTGMMDMGPLNEDPVSPPDKSKVERVALEGSGRMEFEDFISIEEMSRLYLSLPSKIRNCHSSLIYPYTRMHFLVVGVNFSLYFSIGEEDVWLHGENSSLSWTPGYHDYSDLSYS